MEDEVSSGLADWICEFLTFRFSPEDEENLRAEARKLNLTYEQGLAMTLTESIREKFQVARRSDVN